MELDDARIDDAVLALLHLNSFRDHGGTRAWKSLPWDALDRLCEKGLIGEPRSKAKSVILSDEAVARAEELVIKLFGPN